MFVVQGFFLKLLLSSLVVTEKWRLGSVPFRLEEIKSHSL